MDMVLCLSVNINLISLFSVTYVVGTHSNCQFQCVHTAYVFPIINCFTISFS